MKHRQHSKLSKRRTYPRIRVLAIVRVFQTRVQAIWALGYGSSPKDFYQILKSYDAKVQPKESSVPKSPNRIVTDALVKQCMSSGDLDKQDPQPQLLSVELADACELQSLGPDDCRRAILVSLQIPEPAITSDDECDSTLPETTLLLSKQVNVHLDHWTVHFAYWTIRETGI